MLGFRDGLLQSRTAYNNLLNGGTSNIHPQSALFSVGVPPEFVTYHEVVMTTRPYMHCITAVQPQWLVEAGPKFFSLGHGGALTKKVRT